MTLIRTLAALAALGFTLSAAPAFAQEGPAEIVERTAGKVLADLNANRATYQSDPSGLRKIVREDLIPLFDLEFTARLILGRAGRDASAQQVSAFADALSTQLIRRYTDGLLQYESRDQLDVLPLRGENSEKMTRVRTRVKLSDGQFVPVDYAFRKTDEGWKAFDVIIEGISYVTTYRNQISPRVAADGIDEVTRALNEGELQLDDDA